MNRLFISHFTAPFASLALVHDGTALWQVHFNPAATSEPWPEADMPAWLSGPLHAYLEGDLDALAHLPLHLEGTPFQLQVWEALRRIPGGSAWSYARLASAIGNPRACRAVGSANGCNPAGLIVPCHRVIAADGRLGGYSGGLEIKRWLLRHEGVAFRE